MENELPEGWIEVPISEVAELLRGVSYDKFAASDQPKSGHLPILRATNIQDEHLVLDAELVYVPKEYVKSEQLLKPEDMVICMSSGSKHLVGKTAQLTQEWEGSFGAFCAVARFSKLLNRRFARCFFMSMRYRNLVSNRSSGININNLRHSDIEVLSFPIPPLSEQNRIVAAIEQQFSRLDAAITSLQHVRAKLKRQRAAILKAAVEGTLTAEWRAQHPASETAEQLLQRILHERRAKWEAEQLGKKKVYKEPEPLDTTNLPELPEGWCWASFGQCFEVQVGATPSRKIAEYWGGDIPWVSSGEVQFCRIRSPREHITEAGINNSSTQINPVGSVLLGMIGEGRTRGQVAILDIEACNNQNCAAIWVSQTPVFPEFIYYWLWSQYEVTRQGSSGNNQPALNKNRIEQMIFPLVPVTEQNQIVSEIEASLSIIAQTELEVEANLKRAERLRQTILAQAFAGRLVPQNPADEPASMLLERIHREREGTQKKGKAGNERASSAIKVPDEPVKIDVQDTRQVELWESVGG